MFCLFNTNNFIPFSSPKDIICYVSALERLKATIPVICFVELCIHIIPKVSNDVQTQINL